MGRSSRRPGRDEVAKWPYVDETWTCCSSACASAPVRARSTPRPIPLLKPLVAGPRVAVSRAATHINARKLAPSFLDAVVGRYKGTRLGRQDIDGDIVEDRADGLWTRDVIEGCRVSAAPPLVRVVVAVDPPASSRAGADACGIVAAGIDAGGIGYVLADATVS